uniref:Immunoglobulin domain-containing protein n=1 Tax=Echeneis naucrates TaxID=173247 RepID=A0A665TFV8_ECHNA
PIGASVCWTSLAVRPDSSQLFEGDTISFRCDDGWTMRRNTSQLQQTECGNDWGNLEGSVCDISFLFPFESGSYWCESKGGGVSNSVTIKITGKTVILQSPVLPVMEGHDVHLLCRTKSPSNRPANFYRNDVLIGSEPEGHMTLRHVNKSAEGLYKCVVRGQGESESSWVSRNLHLPAPPLLPPPPGSPWSPQPRPQTPPPSGSCSDCSATWWFSVRTSSPPPSWCPCISKDLQVSFGWSVTVSSSSSVLVEMTSYKHI